MTVVVHKTPIEQFTLKQAKIKDIPLILSFIKKLAAYENLSHEVSVTEDVLKDSLFVRKSAEVYIANYEDKPVGFMLFYYNFSTFNGKPGIYLEDLYIDEPMRHRGFGKAMLGFLANLTIKRDCLRLEWACLDWNHPSIDFYKKLKSSPLNDWTVYRLSGENLNFLAQSYLKGEKNKQTKYSTRINT
ncbi:MAG: GNAT family N-acetyltransferase [Clostridiales bacterium]|nr:GNAT family N-acetyltransferase [Clostridiales bacterium]